MFWNFIIYSIISYEGRIKFMKNSNLSVLFINTSPYSRMSKLNSISHPLGVMSLASYVRENGFSNVKILDRNASPSDDTLYEILKSHSPKVIAISCMNFTSKEMMRIAKVCKTILPHSIVVTGGPYVNSVEAESLNCEDVDISIYGEGELTILDIVQKVSNKEILKGIDGTFERDQSGEVIKNPQREYIQDLDQLPDPAYDLIDLEFYNSRTSMSEMGIRPYMTLFSSRACPYHCTYCHDIFGKTFRGMSAERMVAQIELLIEKYGIRDFEFVDDIWNFDHNRVRKFCKLVIEKELNIVWHFPNGVRGDLFFEDELILMKKAGCKSMSFAIESNNRRIQKVTKKNLRIKKITKNIDIATREGIFTIGFFMIGFPNESLKEILRTCWYIVRSPLCVAYISQPIPFEKTELREEIEDLKGDLDAPHKSLDHNYSQISNRSLMIIMFITNMLFYLNIWRIYKIITTFPSLKLLTINLIKFLGLLVFRDDEFDKKLPTQAFERFRLFLQKM